MKTKICLVLVLVTSFTVRPTMAQFQMTSKLKSKAERKVAEKASNEADKALGSATNQAASTPQSSSQSNTEPNQDKEKRAAYKSKFDFIPGEQVLQYYDFMDISVGDIPSDWQIDGSAEVVEIEGYDGHYMMLHQKSAALPINLEDMPDDFTVQFDLLCTNPYTWGSSKFYFLIAKVDPNKDIYGMQNDLGSINNKVLWLSFHPGSQNASANKGYGNYEMITKEGTRKGEDYPMESFIDTDEGRLAKISIWRQKRRVRLYVNETKILDMTTLLPDGMKVNAFVWNVYSGYYNEDKYFIGNIRIAAGLPDTRKNLAANGKYVTTGILFDVNSDVIKPESYGVIKEIATILKATPGVKVTIIGHTDSDGDEAKNLALSRRRAESVKKALVNDFAVDGNLLSTDGKGEAEPFTDNDTPQNKANNRRVEFVVSK